MSNLECSLFQLKKLGNNYNFAILQYSVRNISKFTFVPLANNRMCRDSTKIFILTITSPMSLKSTLRTEDFKIMACRNLVAFNTKYDAD